jgi:hypothetical protein
MKLKKKMSNFLPLLDDKNIQARIMPRCTSFTSTPHSGEVIIRKNAVILPEQSGVFRWELVRQYLATLQWLPAG